MDGKYAERILMTGQLDQTKALASGLEMMEEGTTRYRELVKVGIPRNWAGLEPVGKTLGTSPNCL
jgi:hypothetical protein